MTSKIPKKEVEVVKLDASTSREEVQGKIDELIALHPTSKKLILALVEAVRGEEDDSLGHKNKKAKLQNSSVGLGEVLISFPELSFQFPVRKKARMILHKNGLSLTCAGSTEFTLMYKDIDKLLCMATPTKQKPNYTMLIISKEEVDEDRGPALPHDRTIVFSFDTMMPKFMLDTELNIVGEDVSEYLVNAFKHVLPKLPIVLPKKDHFVSKDNRDWEGEPSRHLVAYDRAKDGVIFFFEDGFFYGFKKPLMFYHVSKVKKVEITSRTQRFFSIHIILKEHSAGEFVEYSMLPVVEHDGLVAYLAKVFGKKNISQDVKVNKVPAAGTASSVAGSGAAAPTTLANIELADEEEDDEDYKEVASKGSDQEDSDSSESEDENASDNDDSSMENGEEDIDEEDVEVYSGGEDEVSDETANVVKKSQVHFLAVEEKMKARKQSPSALAAAARSSASLAAQQRNAAPPSASKAAPAKILPPLKNKVEIIDLDVEEDLEEADGEEDSRDEDDEYETGEEEYDDEIQV